MVLPYGTAADLCHRRVGKILSSPAMPPMGAPIRSIWRDGAAMIWRTDMNLEFGENEIQMAGRTKKVCRKWRESPRCHNIFVNRQQLK